MLTLKSVTLKRQSEKTWQSYCRDRYYVTESQWLPNHITFFLASPIVSLQYPCQIPIRMCAVLSSNPIILHFFHHNSITLICPCDLNIQRLGTEIGLVFFWLLVLSCTTRTQLYIKTSEGRVIIWF